MILSQFHIFPADGKTLFLDLVYFLATPLYKPFACPFFHVQNKCSSNKCCLCSLWFLRTRVNVPRHKAAQVWRRRSTFFVLFSISKTIKNKTKQCCQAQGSTSVVEEGVCTQKSHAPRQVSRKVNILQAIVCLPLFCLVTLHVFPNLYGDGVLYLLQEVRYEAQ